MPPQTLTPIQQVSTGTGQIALPECAEITQGRAVPCQGWLGFVAGVVNIPAHINILMWPHADASAADPAALRKQRLQQAAQEGRLQGPRPMPAGWKVVLRESKRDGRLLKRYRVRASSFGSKKVDLKKPECDSCQLRYCWARKSSFICDSCLIRCWLDPGQVWHCSALCPACPDEAWAESSRTYVPALWQAIRDLAEL